MTEDAVDRIVEQWHRELPELELESMATFGRIHRVSQNLSARLAATFAEHGIGRTEFDVLASLRRSGEPFVLSPKQISASLMLSSGGLTGRLDKLERAGLIERLPDPDDRRGLKVRMTDAGRTAIEGAVRAALEVQREALAVLNQKECEELGALLRKLHAGFEDQPLG
ncbi:MarR family transcriptional regulator [Glycomyces sp. L485]|uniref:MarR family winged helix-turn-helix transcriptional regulator n=1 Tax=Glycomyces sp. L485 TaxID=2909235 RepID=UPI001F4A24DB|nr:MarR family transcriptional regulator [Glycomyces sp. L485]MCH7232404.1 MarR family transcriptional regulator [Glycomyces sp. L485]